MIEARQLCKRFGSFVALDQVTFTVEKGEVAAFLGLNGAGKTTTMRILSSFTPPTSGAVKVAGFDTVRQSDQVRRHIGYLPERVPLYDDLRVTEYLRYRCRLKGLKAREARVAVDRVVSRCGLKIKEGAIIGTLSKGYRQRVGIADALAHDPDLLILDEPTSGLDPGQRREIRALIQELGEERTVLLSTHILPEAEAVCRRVIIIHGGMIRASDDLDRMRDELAATRVRYTGEALPEHLERGFEARPENGACEVHCTSEEQGSRIVAEAVQAGRRVLGMTSEPPSLERIFMHLTAGKDEVA